MVADQRLGNEIAPMIEADDGAAGAEAEGGRSWAEAQGAELETHYTGAGAEAAGEIPAVAAAAEARRASVVKVPADALASADAYLPACVGDACVMEMQTKAVPCGAVRAAALVQTPQLSPVVWRAQLQLSRHAS